jgi:hypothetical protein
VPPPPPPPGYGGYAPPPPTYGYAPPPPGYGPPAGNYGTYPPGYGYPGTARRTDGTAIAALVLAITSFIVCPLIPAIVALAMIPGARRTIVSSGGAVEGLGILTAAKVIAWINVGLCALGLAFFILAVAVSSSSSNNAVAAVLSR